jgi:hypothetical protein
LTFQQFSGAEKDTAATYLFPEQFYKPAALERKERRSERQV